MFHTGQRHLFPLEREAVAHVMPAAGLRHVAFSHVEADECGALNEWLDAPHLPHAWECGFLFEQSTGTLFCGDLFTQPGDGRTALTEADILGPSEAFRHAMDYFSHTKHAGALLEKLANTRPTTHGLHARQRLAR